MATYLLTTGDDTITGTADADTFDETNKGETEGVDKLSGGDGNDVFLLLNGDDDTVDGGSGFDTVQILTTFSDLKTNGVEALHLVNPDAVVYTSVEEFSKFQVVSTSDPLTSLVDIRLGGKGGTLDLRNTFSGGTSVEISGGNLTSGLVFKGIEGSNRIQGTKYDDSLEGGDSSDTFVSSKGFDKLFGHGGDDKFYLDIFSPTGGSIDGGTGLDTLYIPDGNISSYSIKNVDTLRAGAITSSIAILDGFGSIIADSNKYINVFLVGSGGTIDFSHLVKDGSSLDISANPLTSAATIIGSTSLGHLLPQGEKGERCISVSASLQRPRFAERPVPSSYLLPLWGEERSAEGREKANDLAFSATNARSESGGPWPSEARSDEGCWTECDASILERKSHQPSEKRGWKKPLDPQSFLFFET